MPPGHSVFWPARQSVPRAQILPPKPPTIFSGHSRMGKALSIGCLPSCQAPPTHVEAFVYFLCLADTCGGNPKYAYLLATVASTCPLLLQNLPGMMWQKTKNPRGVTTPPQKCDNNPPRCDNGSACAVRVLPALCARPCRALSGPGRVRPWGPKEARSAPKTRHASQSET